LPDAVSELPDMAAVVLASMNVFLVLLAALLCGNVAMLLFARAVSRERELLVRAALGAGRGRLILQFFAEALVLCAVGAAVGLLVARVVLGRTWTRIEGQAGPLPFWIDTSLSATTILYAVGLTLFAAAIAGVVPAFKVTSGGTGARLRAASSGGGGLQFGGVWTVIIVVQIAFTTLLPWPLLGLGGGSGKTRRQDSRPRPFSRPRSTSIALTASRRVETRCRRCVRCGSKHATVCSPTGSDRSRACWTSRTPIKCRN
jgi:hypothetical protein